MVLTKPIFVCLPSEERWWEKWQISTLSLKHLTTSKIWQIALITPICNDADDDDKKVGPGLPGERGGNKYKLGNVGCKCSTSIGTMGIKSHYHHCTATVCSAQMLCCKYNKYNTNTTQHNVIQQNTIRIKDIPLRCQ